MNSYYQKIIFASFILLNLALVQHTQAVFPDHPIRLVVPSGAGGVTDSLARLLSTELSKNLGQSVFVENRPGASGIAGTQFVASAAPDGYTLLMVFPTHVTNPTLFSKLPYDTIKAFAPISLVSSVSMVFVVPKDSPANTLKEFIVYAKANPGKLNFASVGSGSLGHLGAELFNSLAGTSIALGVSTKDRLPILPNVPAMSDSVKGYDVQGWNGILAPAGTPPELIDRLNKAIVKSVASPEFSKKLRQEGATGFSSTPAEFQHLIARDIAKWAKVIKEANIQLD